ncbi:MAG: hypothetical protein Q9159_006073 [Coniocarpon cinnabarinum]
MSSYVGFSTHWGNVQLTTYNLSLGFFALSVLYTVCTVVYRLYFHPLAKFPGTKLAAATKWYECYFDLLSQEGGGQFPWEIDRMHDVYVNPHELHVRDSSWYYVLYNAGGVVRDKYPPAAEMAGTPLAYSAFGTASHDVHRRRRAPIASYFSKKSVWESRGAIKEQLEVLCRRLDKYCDSGEVINVQEEFLAFTSDAFTQLAFGTPFGFQNDAQERHQWHETMKAVATMTNVIKQFPWAIKFAFTIPLSWIMRVYPELGRLLLWQNLIRLRAKAFVSEMADSKDKNDSVKAAEYRPQTIFHAIWRTDLPPEELTVERLGQEGFSSLAAGGETTARALSRALYHLSADPETQRCLEEEVLPLFASDAGPPSLETLSTLPYLSSVIRETLRITGQVAARLPQISPRETLQYKDWVIPAGMLNDPAVFPEPEQFRPERWLQDSQTVANMTKNYVPFSKGTRSCPGLQ